MARRPDRAYGAAAAGKRAFDIALASLALLLAAPLLALAALAVRIASPGPVLYRAARTGRDGRTFTMLKLRTMHVAAPGEAGSRITGPADPRVFALGALLRRTKLDELPQLVNVLRGEMSIVGPRPEDPEIVRRHYTAAQRETLRVRPGLVSPGSIYHFTHGDALLAGADPEAAYAARLLPVKLELERVYVRRASLGYDLALIARAASAIVRVGVLRRTHPEPPELRRISAGE